MKNKLEELRKQLEQEKTLKEMYFTYYKAKHGDIKGELFKLKAENNELKETLKVIASRSCLNLYDCTGHCLPNCKWNAHVLAQQTLEELTNEVEDDRQD